MSLKFIIHGDTRVVVGATTHPLEEIRIAPEHEIVEMPDDTVYDLKDLLSLVL